MTRYLETALTICGPGLIAAALLLLLAKVPAFARTHRWTLLSVASSLAAGLTAFGMAATDLITADARGLLRDALACAALSAAIVATAAVASAFARWRKASASRAALLAALPILVLVGAAPLIVRLVHCTSGDCL